MTRCREWLEPVSASLDGELGAAEREAAHAHLAACAECADRLDALRALKHAVARLPSREAPPGAVRAHAEALALRSRRASRVGPAARVALAASLLAAAWAFVSTHRHAGPPDPRLAEELAADHLHSVPEAMPAEVVTGDPDAAVRFFSGRLPFTPVAPRLDGARLTGGRLCKIRGRRVQLLFYRDQADTTVSVFVADQDLGGAGCRAARGLQVCSRRAGGLTLLAVGETSADRLRRLLDSAAF